MNSKALNVRTWGFPTSVHGQSELSRSRVRDKIIAASVILLHAIGLYVVVHASSESLRLESSRPSGSSIQVSLVTASASQPKPQSQPEIQPKPKSLEAPEVKATPPRPHKAAVLSSSAPSTRTVAQDQPVPAKPIEPPTPQVASTPSQPRLAISSPPVASQAPGLPAAPKELSAGEFRQLGCEIPQPEYPTKAKRLEQSGTVVVAMTVEADGSLHSVHVTRTSGYESLDEAAVASIRAGHCHPYTDNGVARAVTASQGIAFNLND
jgi:periplasmic protein TonB